MNITIDNILFIGSILLLISIIAGKTSYRFGVPTLLLFLVIGMLAGTDGIGEIYFDNPRIAQFIGIVSLNFILFSGGLDTNWQSVKPVLWEGISLSTVGVLLTALTLGTFVWAITDLSIYESLLLGSIVSSTDAAAVFSILRAKSLALKVNLRPTLELESGSNDPMAYVLTLIFLTLTIHQDQSIWEMIPLFFSQMILGGVLGFGFGKLSKLIINKIKLDFEGLYPVLTIALMFITFSATDYVGGNGFLAIYICAVFLGNQRLIHKKTIMKMFDGMAWLMQIVLFLTLGLLVYPSQIIPVLGIGMVISAFLIFVARPLAVFLCLAPFKMKTRRRFYISWVGLRGAVPIVFATFALIEEIPNAQLLFNIVFFVSVSSVLLQGTTLGIVAKWLHVALPQKAKPMALTDAFLVDTEKGIIEEIALPVNSYGIGRKIVDLQLPQKSNIALIKRNEKYLTPSGSTLLQEGDLLITLSEDIDAHTELKEVVFYGK
ncbi:MAG: potassium/proton antiporter [Flavobacterium sp.]